MKIDHKNVWITGASSGIGEALAHQCAARGARVAVSARRRDRLESIRAAWDTPPRIEVCPMDQEDLAALPGNVDAAWDALGGIDVAVLNAGITQTGPAVETPLEILEKVMHVNFFATTEIARRLVPKMLERGGGQLVITSSLLGKFGVQQRSGYCASKHALHGYFDALRCELVDQPIQITLVCPGFVHTETLHRAIRPDGSLRGPFDDNRNALTPDRLADRMLRAIERDVDEVNIGQLEVAAAWLKRLAPSVLNRVLPLREIE